MGREQQGTYRIGTAVKDVRSDGAQEPRLQTRSPAGPQTATINRYRISDPLWSKLKPIIDTCDPPVRTSGRKRIDPRGALDAIIYQTLTGCGWNRLPSVFPDDSSVHRTYQRWKQSGLLNRLWAAIVEEDMERQTRAG